MKIAYLSAAAALLACTTALATGVPETKPSPTPTVVIDAAQYQGQAQQQAQQMAQEQRQQASANAAASASGMATASNGGNTQNTHIVTRESAAALAQGSLVLGECGFGANGGGSGRGGAGFLGIAFQTPQCNDFKLAGYYFTIGDYATGCAIIAETPAGKRQAKRGIILPQCENPKEPTPVPQPSPVTVNVAAASADCKAATDAAFKQCVAK